MSREHLKIVRNQGYELIINTFEPFLRFYTVSEIFQIHYPTEWMKHIPDGVKKSLLSEKGLEPKNVVIDVYFEEMTLLNLKDVLIFSDNFTKLKPFIGTLSKTKFIELMDALNKSRIKIAHAKSTFTKIDFIESIQILKLLIRGECSEAVELNRFIENESYKNAKDIPVKILEEYKCLNNLPPEDYDLDGGFVGRVNEFKKVKKCLESNLDRIITISGAGGVGKTAIALKVVYDFLSDARCPFEGILWFSAKDSKLTEHGITAVTPEIKSDKQLMQDMCDYLNPEICSGFRNAKVGSDTLKKYLYKLFESQKYLVVIDNLETILRDKSLVNFIKDIPRPTKILITSRKGLGEIERRLPLGDLSDKDAVHLFRLVARQKCRVDLVKLNEIKILELVRRVKCYPLLIKWSIGQVCLGKEIDKAFLQIFDGESEIAKFVFNDVFTLLSKKSKTVLYSMIIYGNKPVSRNFLLHMTNFSDDELDDALEELILTSFIFQEAMEVDSSLVTQFSMLTLTRGFVITKFDIETEVREMLSTRYYHLSEQVRELEKSKSRYSQSLISFGIRTVDEQIAFNYIKTAKNYATNGDFVEAEINYKKALKIAPKLAYVLTEYSKFEFLRGHPQNAKTMAKKAVDADVKNYHAWFNYGILLKRMEEFETSISCLKKAKQLNSSYLPIYNELGRVYTILGEYEKAHDELEIAMREEKYPNYRHKLMTLQNIADNYKRWSEAFMKRRDFEGQKQKLKEAFKAIADAKEIAPNDSRIILSLRKISSELGRNLCLSGEIKDGKQYLLKCIQPKKTGETYISQSDIVAAIALCNLLEACLKDSDLNGDEIRKYLDQAAAIISPESNYFVRFKKLEKEFNRRISPIINGCVQWYDTNKKYGVVESNGKTHMFFQASFAKIPTVGILNSLEGRKVKFKLKAGSKGDMIAVDVVIAD
ncbi:NB-ARC domain-containing protein [Candidatus Omnitrophota bacterium]